MKVSVWLSTSWLQNIRPRPYFICQRMKSGITYGIGRIHINLSRGPWKLDWQGDDDTNGVNAG